MGRKTFEEIGKPLDKRKNIVLTGEPEKYQKLEKTYQGSLFFTDEKPESLLKSFGKRRLSNSSPDWWSNN